jgi:hypothetical protein
MWGRTDMRRLTVAIRSAALSRYGPVAGFCEHENERSADIRGEELLVCLNEYYCLRTTLIQHMQSFL